MPKSIRRIPRPKREMFRVEHYDASTPVHPRAEVGLRILHPPYIGYTVDGVVVHMTKEQTAKVIASLQERLFDIAK